MLVNVDITVDAHDLALSIVRSANNRDDILKFIYLIDDAVAEYEFTEILRDKLTEILKAEDDAK